MRSFLDAFFKLPHQAFLILGYPRHAAPPPQKGKGLLALLAAPPPRDLAGSVGSDS